MLNVEGIKLFFKKLKLNYLRGRRPKNDTQLLTKEQKSYITISRYTNDTQLLDMIKSDIFTYMTIRLDVKSLKYPL